MIIKKEAVMNAKNIPAGYQLVNMGGTDISTAGGVTVTGVNAAIQQSNGKLLILYNLVIGDTAYPNAVPVMYDGAKVTIPNTGTFTVTDADLVAYTASGE